MGKAAAVCRSIAEASLASLRVAERGVFAIVLIRLIQRISQQGVMRGAVKPLLSHLIAGAKKVPGARDIVQGELDKEIAKIEYSMLGDGDADAILKLPEEGLAAKDVKVRIAALRASDGEATADQHFWAGIYHPSGTALSSLQLSAVEDYHETNVLYPGVFPSLRKLEAEVVAMIVEMVHGTCGLFTSGGTESILIATLAYREWGRQRGIENPEVLCCRTAHPALDKACHYFGLKLITLDQGAAQELNPAAVRGALTRNTVMVYASAPTFPHGIVDPIEELGSMCNQRGVGLHVDNCLGGIYLSFLQKLGVFQRQFDFRVPGVTSMSVDLHKYGYASKGASVVAFKDPELRRLTYVPVAGLEFYITPTLQGSRGGAAIATAWATLLHFGENGYKEQALKLWSFHEAVSNAVQEIPGLQLLLPSHACVIPIVSGGDLNIHLVASDMEKRGWNLFTAREPSCMCLCYGEQHIDLMDTFIKDLRLSVDHVRMHPADKVEGGSAIYGAASLLPDDVLKEAMRSYCDIKMTVKPIHPSRIHPSRSRI